MALVGREKKIIYHEHDCHHGLLPKAPSNLTSKAIRGFSGQPMPVSHHPIGFRSSYFVLYKTVGPVLDLLSSNRQFYFQVRARHSSGMTVGNQTQCMANGCSRSEDVICSEGTNHPQNLPAPSFFSGSFPFVLRKTAENTYKYCM